MATYLFQGDYSFVPNCRAGVELQILKKNPSSSFKYYKRMT